MAKIDTLQVGVRSTPQEVRQVAGNAEIGSVGWAEGFGQTQTETQPN